ncbi:MAG: glycosyltransferase family 39 protein [Chloroflexi bacterium]|nr:glycosyltransferase family 39 protein [Chloroflexota bacterium]
MGQTKVSFRGINEKLEIVRQHQWIPIGILLITTGLSYMAHRAFKEADLWEGLRWLGFASLLLIIFTPMLPSKPYPDRRQLGIADGARVVIGVGFLLIGFGTIVYTGTEFWKAKPGLFPSQATWNTFGLGVTLWVLGGVILTHAIPKKLTIDQTTAAFLQPLLIMAIFLRVYHLKTLPLGIWYDEAVALLDARSMLHHASYRPFFVPNITYPHLMLYAQALRAFGETNVAGPRLVHVFFGVAAVFSSFLVGDMLRGRWFGLLMGFFMAVLAWAITFSRIAMTGIETCFFTMLTFYFLMRMVRYGQLRDGLWAGLTVGVGLYFYAAFRFALVPLAIYGLLAWRWWKPQALLITGFGAITAVLVFMPMLIFAKLDPDLYTNRNKQVTIFREENRGALPLREALDISLDKHLGMFHVIGDRNGRHNLPYDPMLDVVTGVVFVLGMGLALRHLKHAEEWFFGGLLVVSMLAGILTVQYEAPQALRTIGVLPAIAYFAALTIEEVGRVLSRAKLQPLVIGCISILLGATLYLNYDKYFEKQARSHDAWLSYSTTATIVGQLVQDRPDHAFHAFFVSPLMFGEPSTEFLVPDYQQKLTLLNYPDTLPLRVPPTGPVTIILDESEFPIFNYAKTLYPQAQFKIIKGLDYGIRGAGADAPVMYVIDLTPEDIAGIQKLNADGTGILYAPQYGEYRFYTDGLLMIDGELWQSGEGHLLAEGNHVIQITPNQTLEWEVMNYTQRDIVPDWMLYHGPITNNGLHGYFYPNADWSGAPVLERIDPFLDMYFHRIPLLRPYTVTWKGFLDIPEDGVYGIGLRAMTSGEILIDGVSVVKGSTDFTLITKQLELTAGRHPIEVRLLDAADYSRIHILWVRYGDEIYVPIPREALTPY